MRTELGEGNRRMFCQMCINNVSRNEMREDWGKLRWTEGEGILERVARMSEWIKRRWEDMSFGKCSCGVMKDYLFHVRFVFGHDVLRLFTLVQFALMFLDVQFGPTENLNQEKKNRRHKNNQWLPETWWIESPTFGIVLRRHILWASCASAMSEF